MKMCRQKSGIMLIEVCLVISIISIFFLISWPVFSKIFSRMQLEKTARIIEQTIGYARDLALIENRKYQISFNLLSKKYSLSYETDPINKPSQFVLIQNSLSKNYILPENISIIEISKLILTFEPNGPTENFYIKLKNTKGSKIDLKFDGVSGRCLKSEEI